MPKDDLVYVGHMLDIATRVQEKMRGLRRTQYDADENLRLAVTHLLQTIGEAARQVSVEFRDAHPEVPWQAIVGMRHRVVHDYMTVDENIVWETATVEVPTLIAALSPMLP